MLIPVILAGGQGKRLWPLSRNDHPKQLLPLFGQYTPFQNTLKRLLLIQETYETVIIICNAEYRHEVKEQADLFLKQYQIMTESTPHNTAVCVAVAALYSKQKYGDATLLILPSDQYILDEQAWANTIVKAQAEMPKNKLVIFGVPPDAPRTEYGYIKPGKLFKNEVAKVVSEFIEKPSLSVAKSFYDSGDYYWNSGMFLFTVSCILKQIHKYAPDMLKQCENLMKNTHQEYAPFIGFNDQSLVCNIQQSIDKVIFEHTDQAIVFPLQCGWFDLGSFETLYKLEKKDKNKNVIFGNVYVDDSKNNYIHADSRLVVCLGLNNTYVVETKDTVLIASQENLAEIKTIIHSLEERNQTEIFHSLVVYRPWGHYEVIEAGARYQVKHLYVKPGASISLQMHYNRSEHWVIVSGTGLVTKGEESTIVAENESVYVPCGVKHRLENCGKIPLHVIEIQTGSYFGEDDIIRYDDIYHR